MATDLSTTLSTSRLEVLIDAPGASYLGSRFDWTTQVRQIILDGRHRLLTREKEADSSPADQGWGLAGEFGIDTPVGYDACPVGGAFPKIGVGLLTKPDDEAYFFARPYTVRPARFSVRPSANAVLITAAQEPERGFGWMLKRHWSVAGATLALTTTLANTGSRALATEEYIHNFFGFNEGLPTTDWVLTLPAPLSKKALAAWVDPENVMVLKDRQVRWTGTGEKDFFFSHRAPPVSPTWTLTHQPTGVTVTETGDFPVSHFNLWGRAHVVSPELYRKLDVAPGAVVTWTRTWTFG